MRLSDPKHFDHILPFLQPADVHHSIPLDSDDIGRMHAIDDAATFEAGEHDMQTHAVGETPDAGEQDAGEPDAGNAMLRQTCRASLAHAHMLCSPAP